MDRFSLDGKVALITGGGRGIGAAIARGFSEAGASVVVVSRTKEQVEEVAEEIRSSGGQALALVADVRDLGTLPDLVDRTVAEFGGIDTLVNNAGGEVSPPFMETTVDHIRDAIHFNVLVPFELSRLAVPHLLKRPGASIINNSSVTTLVSVRGSLAHHVGKTAESQLTLSMAADLGPKIRVNALLPGAIETEALKGYWAKKNPEARDALIERTRLKRMGTPDDVASAAIYLASPASSWVTGCLLEVTGGIIHEMKVLYPDL